MSLKEKNKLFPQSSPPTNSQAASGQGACLYRQLRRAFAVPWMGCQRHYLGYQPKDFDWIFLKTYQILEAIWSPPPPPELVQYSCSPMRSKRSLCARILATCPILNVAVGNMRAQVKFHLVVIPVQESCHCTACVMQQSLQNCEEKASQSPPHSPPRPGRGHGPVWLVVVTVWEGYSIQGFTKQVGFRIKWNCLIEIDRFPYASLSPCVLICDNAWAWIGARSWWGCTRHWLHSKDDFVKFCDYMVYHYHYAFF